MTMFRETTWVNPSQVHHFRHVNLGRGDTLSWGKPETEIPPLFRLAADKKGEGTPIGWDISKGVVVAHLIGDVTPHPEGSVTVEAACAERVARLASLKVLDTPASLVYEALYFANGEPIPPTYIGVTCNRRSFAFPQVVGQWLDADRTRKVGDFVIPLSCVPFLGWDDTLSHILGENNQVGRKPYSPIGLLHIVQNLARKGYGETKATTAAGIGKRGMAQKVYRIVLADTAFPSIGLVKRLSLDPEDYTTKVGDKKVVQYQHDGYIPFGPLQWTDIATLMGVKKKDGFWYNAELAPSDGHCATNEEMEAYIRGVMTGATPDKVGMATVKTWAEQFAPSPITARVGDVLTAIVAGNRDYFSTLLTPAKPVEPPKVVAPPVATTQQQKGGKYKGR